MTIIAASFKSESGDSYLVLVNGSLEDLTKEINEIPEELIHLMLEEVQVIGDVLTARQVKNYIVNLQEEAYASGEY